MARRKPVPELSPARLKALLAVAAILAAAVVADLFVEHHPAFWIDGTPAFAAWFGFGAAIVAVALSLGWASLAAWKGRPRDD